MKPMQPTMVTYRAPDLEPPTPIVDQWLMDVSAELWTTLPLIAGGILALALAVWFDSNRRRNRENADA